LVLTPDFNLGPPVSTPPEQCLQVPECLAFLSVRQVHARAYEHVPSGGIEACSNRCTKVGPGRLPISEQLPPKMRYLPRLEGRSGFDLEAFEAWRDHCAP